MSSPKSQRKGGQEKNRKAILSERASSSFHVGAGEATGELLTRPRTVSDLLIGRRSAGMAEAETAFNPSRLTKLLVNVTVQRSLGAVKLVIPFEATVEQLITAALQHYVKETRLPSLLSVDSSRFDLHYSQFCLESLHREEKLIDLGSRTFFLCAKNMAASASSAESAVSVANSSSRCSNEAGEACKKGNPCLKFMDFFTVEQKHTVNPITQAKLI